MNIEEEIINEAGRQMAREIDFQIIVDLLVGTGWKKVVLNPMTWEEGDEIDRWCEQQVKGKYKNMGLVWIFEQEDDANWFTLRWL